MDGEALPTAQPRRPWSTPQLIVLSRDAPEEHVLVACKFGVVGVGPVLGDLFCLINNPPCIVCATWAFS
jgi:hypothetical protein